MRAPLDPGSASLDLYTIADEIRSIGSEGLEHSDDEHERVRCERLLECSARLVASIERRPPESVLQEYTRDLQHITPLIGVDSLVLDEERVLLIQRADNGLWCMPGGYAEVGETLSQAAMRELREEAGLEGRALRVLGLFDSRLWHSGIKQHMVHVVFLVERISGELRSSAESPALDYFAVSELPPLSHGHRDWLPQLLARLRAADTGTYFDA